MKSQFILYRRNGTYYCEDTKTGKQQSLRTKDEAAANALLHSKNEAYRQPILNQSIALAYLSATDPEAAKRAWQFVMDEMTNTKLKINFESNGIVKRHRGGTFDLQCFGCLLPLDFFKAA